MKLTGTIKVISIKGDRASVKLEDALFFKDDAWEKQDCDVWMSTFESHIIESLTRFDEDTSGMAIQEGSKIQATVKENTGKNGQTYLNIVNIGLEMPESDACKDWIRGEEPWPGEINEGAPSPKQKDIEYRDGLSMIPNSSHLRAAEGITYLQQEKDGLEVQAEKINKKSINDVKTIIREARKIKIVDTQSLLIIRQTCIKASSASRVAKTQEGIVEIAKRLETFVLTGK